MLRKFITKKILLLSSLGLILSSCSKDLKDFEIPLTTNQTNKSIVIDGQTIHAGYGYSPGLDRSFELPFSTSDIFGSTNIPQPFEVEVFTVENNNQLSEITNGESELNGSFNFRVFSIGGDRSKKVFEQINTNEEHVSVIVKIKIQRYKYNTSGTPQLNNKAQNFINNGEYDKFLRTYGGMYVDSQLLGGEIYYYYNYNISNISRMSRSEFVKKASFNIASIFGLGGGGGSTVTSEENEIINSAELNQGVVSNIIGYTPRLITSAEQVQGEIDRVSEYINNNENLASSVKLNLRPYSYVIDSDELSTRFETELNCYLDLEKWQVLRNDILFIKESTNIADLQSKCNSALSEIDSQIENSKNCVNSIPPANGLYSNIKNQYNIETSTVPVYSYYSPSTVDHFYTHNFNELENGNKHWRYDGIAFKILNKQLPNTVAFHRYNNPSMGKHFYTANLGEVSNLGNGWLYEGIVGYIYTSSNEFNVPVYRFYNSRKLDHYYSTNISGINGYTLEGIAAYFSKY